MARVVRSTISGLLESIRADFPQRKRTAEGLMRRHGIQDTLELVIQPPEAFADLPTFDNHVFRPSSSMLRSRFEFAGSWRIGQDVWLTPSQMSSWIRKRSVRKHHGALRAHWEGSAPMSYPDAQLSLFGITEDVPENLVYIVWTKEEGEPEIWTYTGYEEHRFENLREYLRWCLESE